MRKFMKLLGVLLVFTVLLASHPQSLYAKTTQEKIDEAEKEKKKTEQDLKDAEDNVDILSNRQKKLQTKLGNLNEDLESIAKRLDDLSSKVRDKEADISETKEALDKARQIEEEQYESMKKRIQFMYENSSTIYLEILFRAKSFSDFITLNNYIDNLASYDDMKLNEYEINRKSIEDLESYLEKEKENLNALKADAEAEKESIIGVINNTASDIADYDDLIDDAEAAALEYEKKLETQNNNLKALQKQLEEEKRKSREASNSSRRDISEVTFDDGDRMLLANLIYCEAGGEQYAGKVAVGAVVINRVLSSVFPDTVSGVIYQSGQFSPAASGRLASALAVDKANSDCYSAADEAMSGVTNVGNCVYFRTPIEGLTGIQIGNHIFY